MLKTLLVTTALLWPLVTLAEDAPTTPSPDEDAPVKIEAVISKMCIVPLTEKLVSSLKSDFNLAYVYDTPLPPPGDAYVRNLILESKISGETTGGKEVMVLSTFFKDQKAVEQCISSYGVFEPSRVDVMKKSWPPKSVKSPSTDAPTTDAVPAPAPKFQENPDE
jgi:hypothetical protein